MGQQLVISPAFLRSLDDCLEERRRVFSETYNPEYEDLEDNYRLFRKCLRNPRQKVMFNCSKRELIEKGSENPFLGYLIQEDVDCSTSRIETSEIKNAMSFLETAETPSDNQRNNVYLDLPSKEREKRAKQFGVLVLSPDDILNLSSLYKNNGFVIEKGKQSELNFKGYKRICNTITIADLYILTRSPKYNLYKYLDAFIPLNKTEGFTVFIYTMWNDGSGLPEDKYFLKVWKEIKAWLVENRKYDVSLIIVSSTKNDFHNRRLLTNNHYIESGAGFDIIENRDITRQRDNSLYASSRDNDIFEQRGAQTTRIGVFFPVFALAFDNTVKEDYLVSIRELNNNFRGKRIVVNSDGKVINGDVPVNSLLAVASD